jgi:hypothetical protein
MPTSLANIQVTAIPNRHITKPRTRNQNRSCRITLAHPTPTTHTRSVNHTKTIPYIHDYSDELDQLIEANREIKEFGKEVYVGQLDKVFLSSLSKKAFLTA